MKTPKQPARSVTSGNQNAYGRGSVSAAQQLTGKEKAAHLRSEAEHAQDSRRRNFDVNAVWKGKTENQRREEEKERDGEYAQR